MKTCSLNGCLNEAKGEFEYKGANFCCEKCLDKYIITMDILHPEPCKLPKISSQNRLSTDD